MIDPLLVFHKSLVRLVFIHGVFAYHDVHPLFYFNHEGVSALSLTKFNAKLRERHLLSCPVDVEVYDLSGRPTTGNRPDPGSNELFNNVADTKYSTGKMKCTLAVSISHYPLIEFGSVHRSQGRNWARQGVSRAGVAGNF
jgi:hypothetical protein